MPVPPLIWNGGGKGDGYLTLLGRPTDIGFQLGKASYPFSRQG